MLNLERNKSSNYKNTKNLVNSKGLSTETILLNLQTLFLHRLYYVAFEDRLIVCKTKFSSELSKVSSFKWYLNWMSNTSLNFEVLGWP